MTLSVFCILLFAALLHASWNAIVKAGNDKLYAAIGVSGSAAVMALILLPFSPQPAHASIPFLAASTALQVVYTVLVAKTYQVSDMSQTYPLMRGTAPLLVALISVLFLGDSLSSMAWVGIAVICMAILGMACNGRASSQRGVVLALTNACFIAGYTLVDGTGVRLSETALGYTLWSFFLNGAPVNLGDDCAAAGSVALSGATVEKRHFWRDWHYGILWAGAMGHDPGAAGGGRRAA